MSTITFNQWGFGLDLRKGPSTSDANRLRVLKNAYITDGKTVRKRSGCVLVQTLAPGTVGLFAGLGRLNTFQTSEATAVTHEGSLVFNNVITDDLAIAGPNGKRLSGISACEPFNGFLYVVAGHWDHHVPDGAYVTKYLHHYLDGTTPTRVTEAPATIGITKTASKMWAINGDTVAYSKTNDPRDWTEADDAGFLPVGLQQSGSKNATALGTYQNRLVAFFADSAQIWQVDPDPVNNQFLQTVDIGTTRPYAHQNMNGDVFYLSPAGVRTITQQATTENLIDADVGSPIDAALLAGQFIDISVSRAQYVRAAGQYWLYAGTKAVVFTFSRQAKISAWSVYEFPFPLDYIDELDTLLYIRSNDTVYRFDGAAWTDAGALYSVDVETSFVDFQSPGVLKQIMALDAVMTGSGDISHRYDPRSPVLQTDPPVTISGDTRPGNTFPVELMVTNLCTVVHNLDDQEFELHSLSYQFEPLGSI